MKANLNTVLVGSRVVLVPYRPEHVPKYHEWMLDEELRTLTASEPLTLEEEYKMQQKWQLDEDKLTFIILSKESTELPSDPGKLQPTDGRISVLPMVGDVNIFLYGLPSAQCVEDSGSRDEDEDAFYAEVEIMIAEPRFRRKGFAAEALRLMLGYVTGNFQAFSTTSSVPLLESPLKIPPDRLVARVSDTNVASIRLFENLGFHVTKRVEIFNEVEMRYRPRGVAP